MSENERNNEMSAAKNPKNRREFLKQTTGGVFSAAMLLGAFRSAQAKTNEPPISQTKSLQSTAQAVDELTPVAIQTGLTRIWLGENFWANRLEDWRLTDGKIECLKNSPQDALRTASILTRETVAGNSAGALSAKISLIEDRGAGGFAGFLIGAGAGRLDYRAAALVQGFSGTGGGLLAVVETDGRLAFREHTDENKPTAYAFLPNEKLDNLPAKLPDKLSEIVLRLDLKPQTDKTFELVLTASDEGGKTLAGITRRGVADADLIGGIMLVSSTKLPARGTATTNFTPVSNAVGASDEGKNSGARFAFSDIKTGGGKIAVRDERRLEAILGAMYSVNGKVLKLSAQLMPIADAESGTARLEYRAANDKNGVWQKGQTAEINRYGYTVLFRLTDWDSSKNWEYRVVYESGAPGAKPAYYGGIVRRDPKEKETLTIGLVGCVMTAYNRFDAGVIKKEMPRAAHLGRFTPENVYFPYNNIVSNLAKHAPDLLVFNGDQFYETSPTRIENRVKPTYDYFYKWSHWVWAFHDLTRNTPAIVQADDHDVYHPNVWGNGGRHAPDNNWNKGGYVADADWVNMVQRTQCGHNPDAYDPTPVEQGITVYYSQFEYGNVSFAVLEDRKWKTAPDQGEDLDVHEPEMLGARQERFLAEWGKDQSKPKVILTQTLWGCLQTSQNKNALIDFDSNGYPKLKRDRAIELARDARALILCGDQHITSVVRHGLDAYDDAVVQYTIPPGGTGWQRWFEPPQKLPNATPVQPAVTGDFEDAFGNKMRVCAVVNPKFSFAEYRQYNKGRKQGFGDKNLKSEGYGIVRVDKRKREFVLESWQENVDPKMPGARPFEGFPYRLKFEDVVVKKT